MNQKCYLFNMEKKKKRICAFAAGSAVIVCAVVAIYFYIGKAVSDTSYLSYEFENCLYFDSLSDEDKDIYRMFYDLVMHKDKAGYARRVTLSRFEYAAKKDDYPNIYHAMVQDHPEFFFLDGTEERSLEIRGIKTGFFTVLSFRLGPGRADENEMITKFERAADDFLKDIDLTKTDPEIELQIHDKLIDSVMYDHDLEKKDLEECDLGHTAYGALVANSNGLRNRAVCDGYAKSFQYLLQRAGICAAYVSGEATCESASLSEQGSHAWNIVRLDDEWYEVDSCWDDINPPPGDEDDVLYSVIQFEQPQYYKATHHWYNRTTQLMKDLPADSSAAIRVQQGSAFYELDRCKRSTHVRKKSAHGEETELYDFLNRYLPMADGTKYSLKQ